MTDNTQPEALRLAQELDEVPETGGDPDSIQECAAELRRQHTRIAELEAQLESIGAGGVNGPLMGQPQAMPDLSQLKERGAKAWAGVDAQGLRAGRWYMVNKDGMATLCADEADAQREAADAQAIWPGMGPHSAVQLVDAGRASLQSSGFSAEDMATASAQGFRDGVASTAPPAAQAEGWRLIATAPKDGTYLLLWEQYSTNPFVGCWAFGAWTVSHEHVDAEGGWDGANVVDALSMPITHWMPIPAPPTSAEGVEHG